MQQLLVDLRTWSGVVARGARAWWARLVGPAAPSCPRCGTDVRCNPLGAVTPDGSAWVTTWLCPLCALAGYVWEPSAAAAATQSAVRAPGGWGDVRTDERDERRVA